ncbi:MAG: PQQ-binding-like beta-propeller repeat protein [Ignavibacteriales bacterium]|nr:PQQ-binding-like beta-propeller repeat protein [Ignavibacteriales bacterium]
MKKLFLLLITFLFSLIGCKDEGTKPQELPPGYQQDIPWPSLADSPWPMNHHDPQSTGRGDQVGALSGVIEWTLDSLDLHSGSAVGIDSTIYISDTRFLRAISFNGKIKWKLELGHQTLTTPVISNDGTIYIIYPPYVYGIEPTGKIKWKFAADNTIDNDGLNIGKDGTLYFIDSGNKLYALGKDGNLKWSLIDYRFVSGTPTSISPDGGTLYVSGTNTGIIAIDLFTKMVKWSFGEMNTGGAAPLIDNDGNIYLTTSDINTISGNPAFFSINTSGKIRWFIQHNQFYKFSGEPMLPSHPEPTMDHKGNIYFGSDTLYSIDYTGKIRWKKNLMASSALALICDKDNYIYFAKDYAHHGNFDLNKINSDGDIIWSMKNIIGESSSSSPAIINNKIIIPTHDKYIHSIK